MRIFPKQKQRSYQILQEELDPIIKQMEAAYQYMPPSIKKEWIERLSAIQQREIL